MHACTGAYPVSHILGTLPSHSSQRYHTTSTSTICTGRQRDLNANGNRTHALLLCRCLPGQVARLGCYICVAWSVRSGWASCVCNIPCGRWWDCWSKTNKTFVAPFSKTKILTSSKILSKWHGRSTPIFFYTNGQPTKLEPHPSFLRKGMHHLSPIPGWFPTSLLWCTKISVNKYIHMKNATGQPTKLEPHPSFLGRKGAHHLSPIPRWIPPSLPWCTRIYTYQYTCPSSYNNNLTTRGGEGKGGGRKKDPWTPMDTHGYPWMSMDVNRLPWGCKINAGWAIQDSFF